MATADIVSEISYFERSFAGRRAALCATYLHVRFFVFRAACDWLIQGLHFSRTPATGACAASAAAGGGGSAMSRLWLLGVFAAGLALQRVPGVNVQASKLPIQPADASESGSFALIFGDTSGVSD